MKYLTLADLDQEFGATEVTQLQSRDALSIDAAVDWAESLADDFLYSAGITVPTPVPKELIGYLCDLARWRLYDDELTDTVQKRYDEAKAWFMGLLNGRLKPSWAMSSTSGLAYSQPSGGFTRD